jgi:hypothetical protein
MSAHAQPVVFDYRRTLFKLALTPGTEGRHSLRVSTTQGGES